EQMVDALGELLDGIRQTAPSPRVFMREPRACGLADFLELGDERGRLFLRYLRRKDVQDFVSPHKSSFWPSGASSHARLKELDRLSKECARTPSGPVSLWKGLSRSKLFQRLW